MIKSDKNIFSSPVSSDLFVPRLAGRAFNEVRAFQDGILPHPVLDADDHLLQTLLLVKFRLFCRSLFFQLHVIGEKIRQAGVRIGRDAFAAIFIAILARYRFVPIPAVA